jgi:thioredoxin-like negative regulator of GroEL
MDSARLLYNAHYYQLMGRPEIALKELQQAHEADPANLKVVDALARMYQEQGQFQRAQELYQETLKRYGENRALHNNWCFSYYLQGDLGRAESCLQEALALDPGNMAARNNLGLLWCRQGKLAEAKRLWEEAEGAALAQTRMNQALAFLGMSAPAHYAKLAEPGAGAPLADSSAKSPAAEAPPTVKAAPAARHLAAAPKAGVNGAAKATEPGLALPQQPAASRQPKAAAPAIIASQDGSLLVAEGQTSVKGTPAAGLAESAKAPAPQKPAAPVIVTTQAGSLAAEPPLTAKAATPATPGATRPTAGLTEAAKAAPPPAPPVAASSSKSMAVQGKILMTALLAAAAEAKVEKAAKAAAPRTILAAEELIASVIEIRNGTRARMLAHQTQDRLSQQGFHVGMIGNHIDSGAGFTVIYYRPGAERVARVLHSEIFPEAQLAESSKLRKGVAIKILLGRDLLEQPRIMARLRGEEAGASPQKPQPRPTASPRPATSLILAAAAASGAAYSPLLGPPPTPVKTRVHPGVPLATPTAEELIASVIEIRNGTRARMLAHQTQDRLSQQGFHVGMIGNHIDFGAESTVIYYRPGAERVARVLHSEIFPEAQLAESSRLRKGVAIKILLGRDLLAQPQTMALNRERT